MINIFEAWNPEFLERLSQYRGLKTADRKFLADMATLSGRAPDPHAAMTHRQLNHLKDLLDAIPPEVLRPPAPPSARGSDPIYGARARSSQARRIGSDPFPATGMQPGCNARDSGRAPTPVSAAPSRDALGVLWPQTQHTRCKKWHGDIKGTPALLCATEGTQSERFPFELFAIGKGGQPELQSALTAFTDENGGPCYRGVFSGLRLILRRIPRPGKADLFEVFPAG